MKSIKKLSYTVLLLAMLAPSANAQSGSGSRMLADPGDLGQLPHMDAAAGEISPSDLPPTPNEGMLQPESIGQGDLLQPIPMNENYMLQDIAPVESTGTWLQRGYWFTETDVVLLARTTRARNLLLAGEVTTNAGTLGRSLQVRTRTPGVVANTRITLGRFMYRDDDNRDHLTEITYYGAGQEYQEGMVQSLAGGRLFTPTNLGAGNQAFDNSDMQTFSYSSEFGGLEFNYHIRQRMSRDQMVLRPDGQWIRKATPTKTREFYAGLRWFQLNESFVWNAVGNRTQNSRNGSMRISTDNNLIGFQLGAGQHRKFDRFSIGIRGKAGVYVNFTDMRRDFEVFDFTLLGGNTLVQSDSVRPSAEDLAFVGEANLIGRYHIRQNFSLRFSGEMLFVTDLALATNQITFAPGYKVVGATGSSFYLGASFGVEGYW